MRATTPTPSPWSSRSSIVSKRGAAAAFWRHRRASALMHERLAELRRLQNDITADRGDGMIGRSVTVLVDEPGIARSVREAPEIDGVIHVDPALPVGAFAEVEIRDAFGPDLVAEGGSIIDDDDDMDESDTD